MNKHVLALSTALSILAFSPAIAQETAPAAPAVDCTQPANANDPACANQQNNTTGQNSGAGTTTDQNTQTGQTGSQGTDTGTGSSTSTTTTTGGSSGDQSQNTSSGQQQMGMSELIVPADQLNNAQVMSANDYIGKTVYDQAGNNIGEVNDLIVSGDGNVEAVILGVGGFLGIGEKDVAVNTAAVQMVQDGDNTRLVVQASKEALESAPTYDKSNRRYADQATGAGGGTTTDQTGSTSTAPATGETGTVNCQDPANVNDPACAAQNQQNQNQQQQ